MKNIIKQAIIPLFSLYSLFFIIGSVLAPIMAHYQQYEFSARLTALYMYSCHQQPDRSFWLMGYPMALCCRCFGFYLGVFISAIVALCGKLHINFKVFAALFFLCLIDIMANLIIGIRINTGNTTRLIVGIIMGTLFIAILKYLLKLKGENK